MQSTLRLVTELELTLRLRKQMVLVLEPRSSFGA